MLGLTEFLLLNQRQQVLVLLLGVTAKGKVCGNCGQVFPKLLRPTRCAGCAAAGQYMSYCNKDCQAKHRAFQAGRQGIRGVRGSKGSRQQ